MSTVTPSVPPRPSRSTATQDMPLIPPRPARHLERSMSPNREAYTRSPLNELPSSPKGASVYHHRNISASDLEERPPSVSQLPSIGHEGDEYASLERVPSNQEHHRIVSPDLPMYQPTASLPRDAAKSQIQTVTRTDSSQAVAAGIGKPRLDDGQESEKNSLRAKASFNRSTPSLPLTSRPTSIHDIDHLGIPEIGLQVPMYPNAGDVQAPSPAPTATPHTPGVGFFNDGSQRNHQRRRSSRQDLNPAWSYGMHGHGVEPRDQFEKAWYQRHPDELAKEGRHPYDPGHPRSEWAMSSEQLNQLVHSSVNRGLPPSGIPDEQIGYQASDQFSSRKTSPKPAHLGSIGKRPSHGSQTHVESPLRRANFPFNENEDHHALESEDEEHVKDLAKVTSRGTAASGSSVELPAEVAAEPFDIPILASDELARWPTQEDQRAAVEYARKHDEYEAEQRSLSRERHASGHRASSRPSSAHGEPLSRLRSIDRHEGSGVGTPLHEIQEYEPLFPEDDEQPTKKPVNKHLRPDLARHHFPSQDIWEDTPDSLAYTAEVSTPEAPSTPADENGPQTGLKAFETSEQEAERKNGPLPTDRADFLPKETRMLANPRFKPGVLQDIPGRPGLQPRFPSRDIWEDTPDSMRLETTVSEPQSDESQTISPVDSPARPFVPARPAARTQALSPDDVSAETSPVDKKAPVIPERPKPTVLARPTEKSGPAPAAAEASAAKPKPAVPSRPAGKIASLKANFMNDLNSRLQLGPQAPKKEEPKEPEEPAPLADARKSRARGPARRKPAAAETTSDSTGATSGLSFCPVKTWFHRDEAGILAVGAPQQREAPAQTEAEDLAAMPTEAVGAEGDLPEPTISQSTVAEQKEIEPVLAQALASEDKSVSEEAPTAEQQTQTGEKQITITSPEGAQEKLTSIVGGLAPHDGDVLVREDAELQRTE